MIISSKDNFHNILQKKNFQDPASVFKTFVILFKEGSEKPPFWIVAGVERGNSLLKHKTAYKREIKILWLMNTFYLFFESFVKCILIISIFLLQLLLEPHCFPYPSSFVSYVFVYTHQIYFVLHIYSWICNLHWSII